MALFQCNDYKKFLKEKIGENAPTRGYQTMLANAAQCQRSYLSQVLNGEKHLNLEQGAGLCAFWNLNETETQYFLDLIQLQRSGTQQLRSHFEQRLKNARARQSELKSRLKDQKSFASAEFERVYYSSWIYAALHMLASIPNYQSLEAMSRRLQVGREPVLKALQALKRMGLVEQAGDKWKFMTGGFHVPHDSPLNVLHMANWRQRATADAMTLRSENLHYTVVQSHSVADFEWIREELLETITRVRRRVQASPEEELSALCIDFFI